ncbi:MAG: hypothetical protein ACXADS_14505 [Candidatus Thorarchaeota archaeon]|jgi:hypothetical protein
MSKTIIMNSSNNNINKENNMKKTVQPNMDAVSKMLDSMFADLGLGMTDKQIKAKVRANTLGITDPAQVDTLTVKEMKALLKRYNGLKTTAKEDKVSLKNRLKDGLVKDCKRVVELEVARAEIKARKRTDKRTLDQETLHHIVSTFLMPSIEVGNGLYDEMGRHFEALPHINQAVANYKALKAGFDAKVDELKEVLQEQPYEVRVRFWGDKRTGKKGKIHQLHAARKPIADKVYGDRDTFWETQKEIKARIVEHKEQQEEKLMALCDNNYANRAVCYAIALSEDEEVRSDLEEQAMAMTVSDGVEGMVHDNRAYDESGRPLTSSEIMWAEQPGANEVLDDEFFMKTFNVEEAQAEAEVADAMLAQLVNGVFNS